MPTSTSEDARARLVAQAADVGFTACRITRPDAIPQVPARLSRALDEGYHGSMSWMEDRVSWRGDPQVLWPEAKSIVMLAEAYDGTDALAGLEQPETGNISVYSRGKDYHDLVKKRLKRLARWMVAELGCEVKVFVDTAPVAEKPLAAAAGLGWQGKHTNLVGRELGNWFFIGSIFTTAELPTDTAEIDHCGSCTRCLDACPTDAFPAPYQLDARRCISYLTIEHKGPVDEELRPLLGNRIYGCDDCLAVCPWNKFASDAQEMRYAAREGMSFPDLADLAALDDTAFRARFSGSPIKRIGRDRFVRNVLYAIGNSGSTRLRNAAEALANDPSPVVADAAKWAINHLSAQRRP
ncbi:MAG: tRNA epoxyqueuosine(34) reductase QueG [Pseudomonadota bacterium]